MALHTLLIRVALMLMMASQLVAESGELSPMNEAANRYYSYSTTTESGWLLPGEQEGDQKAFVTWVSDNSDAILANWQQLAPSTREKDLLLVAAEQLSANDYLKFVRKAVAMPWLKAEERHIIEILTWGSAQRRGFLAWNYTSPEVRDIFAIIGSALLPDDPIQAYLKDAVTGKQKSSSVSMRGKSSLPETLSGSAQREGVKTSSNLAPSPPTASDEPTSSTPWSVVAVVIVAAIGLLWLLIKNRK